MNTMVEKKTIRLIVVDDNTLIRMGIVSFLKHDNRFQILGEADTGERGIELARRHEPDIVILDQGLPGLDGIEATRILKSHNAKVRVIILTSHDFEEEILAAFSAGADGYCLKNAVSERLPEIILSICDGGAWLDPCVARKVVPLLSSAKPVGALHDGGRPKSVSSLGLTEREAQVLSMIVAGDNNASIAQKLHVSYHTVKSDVTNILRKLSVHDRVQAAIKALKEKLI